MVKVYFEYQNNEVFALPVNPEEIKIDQPSGNSTENIVGIGEINVLSLPSLASISFSSFIPATPRNNPYEIGEFQHNPQFYIDFFKACLVERSPIRIVISSRGVNLEMAVEKFEYSWKGGDEDMWYDLELREYRSYSATIIQSPAQDKKTKQAPKKAVERKNTSKGVAIGSKVKVSGRLHRDSNGSAPGQTEKGAIRKIHLIRKGAKYPYHVTTLDGGWRGWVSESAVTPV